MKTENLQLPIRAMLTAADVIRAMIPLVEPEPATITEERLTMLTHAWWPIIKEAVEVARAAAAPGARQRELLCRVIQAENFLERLPEMTRQDKRLVLLSQFMTLCEPLKDRY